jgi:hypothetical protein
MRAGPPVFKISRAFVRVCSAALQVSVGYRHGRHLVSESPWLRQTKIRMANQWCAELAVERSGFPGFRGPFVGCVARVQA